MGKDYWPSVQNNPKTLARLKKTVSISNINSSMTILDVGCHREELRNFIPVGCKYTGVDFINGFDFDDGIEIKETFDRIFCLEIFIFLKHPKQTLLSLNKNLKNDGNIIISMTNKASLFHRLKGLFGTPDRECFVDYGKHLHFPSFKQSKGFVLEYFDIIKIKNYGYEISPLLAKISPSLFAQYFIFVCKKR